MALPENLKFDTLAVHGGQEPDPTTDVFEKRMLTSLNFALAE